VRVGWRHGIDEKHHNERRFFSVEGSAASATSR